MMMMGFGWIILLVFLAVTVGLAIWLLTYLFPDISDPLSSRYHSQDSPVDILKQRYARGEISKGEYDEMRHSLSQE